MGLGPAEIGVIAFVILIAIVAGSGVGDGMRGKKS